MIDDDRVGIMVNELRLTHLNEFPRSETGAYKSTFSLRENGRQLLRVVFNDIAQSNANRKEIQNNYPARFLEQSIQPIEKIIERLEQLI